MQFDEETLMAFADGALPPDQADAVRTAAETDPQIAARIRDFRVARQAVAALPLAPVPEGLEARIRAMAAGRAVAPQPQSASPTTAPTDNVVAFKPRPRAILAQVGLAAAALVAGILIAPIIGTEPAVPAGGISADLAQRLDSLPSGETDNGLEIVSSFRDGAGALCREYEERAEGQARVSIACRPDGGDWQLRLAVAAGSTEGYEPASSLDVIDAWVVSEGAGEPLSPEDEAAALSGR